MTGKFLTAATKPMVTIDVNYKYADLEKAVKVAAATAAEEYAALDASAKAAADLAAAYSAEAKAKADVAKAEADKVAAQAEIDARPKAYADAIKANAEYAALDAAAKAKIWADKAKEIADAEAAAQKALELSQYTLTTGMWLKKKDATSTCNITTQQVLKKEKIAERVAESMVAFNEDVAKADYMGTAGYTGKAEDIETFIAE